MRLQLYVKYSIFEENSICMKECYHDKGIRQEYCTLEHNRHCR